MLFEDKSKDIQYNKYSTGTGTIDRHINLSVELAEEINKVIAVPNDGNKAVKLNNSKLFNMAIKKFLKELEELPEEEAVQVLRKGALAEVGI